LRPIRARSTSSTQGPAALISGAHGDLRAPCRGVARVQHDKARVLHPAIGIFECADEIVPQRRPRRIGAQIEGAGAGQELPAAERIVDQQAEAQFPGGPQPAVMRQDEAHGPGDVRHRPEQRLALDQGLADQAQLAVFEIAQPPVKELGRGRGRRLREIPLLAEEDRQAPPRSIARDAAAVHAPADDGKIEHHPSRRLSHVMASATSHLRAGEHRSAARRGRAREQCAS
jgi:hypothetical protein